MVILEGWVFLMSEVQGYLAYKKLQPRRTLQWDHA